MIITIGIVQACHAAINSVWSFYLLRLLLGIVEAGLWPGMTYYLAMFYPPKKMATRVGYYFTAAQISAAVVGLVSAGFQKMNGSRLYGWQWMFLIYGIITILDGIFVAFWLPSTGEGGRSSSFWKRLITFDWRSWPALNENDSKIHREDMSKHSMLQNAKQWGFRDFVMIITDIKLWPIIMMYFGVVGVGVGIQNYGSIIISAIDPSISSIKLSLLFAPIWIADLIGILIMTPISDRLHHRRGQFFLIPCTIIIVGLIVAVFAANPWARYSGLLIVGFGLGPTVPICMTWSAQIFGDEKYGEFGVAVAASAVSGLGNLGSIVTVRFSNCVFDVSIFIYLFLFFIFLQNVS